MSTCGRCLSPLLFVLGLSCCVRGQSESSEVKIFGYFQPQFLYQTRNLYESPRNSFVLQQLNLFIQKDLGAKLTSFVNFETVNSYSSDQQWGSFRIEEAWVRYRQSRNLNIRLGLQIPTFNNLNEIKNRMPLIPYVIRPLVYESSFVDVVGTRTYVPQQAFVQVFGWAPVGPMKLDYAAYLGNTELVNSGFNAGEDGRPVGQTGIDTTTSVLVGGRVGIRYGELKAGISGTSDRTAVPEEAVQSAGLSARIYARIPRRRLGADLSYYYGHFSIESEWIDVAFDEPVGEEVNLDFYYVTLGYRVTDRLLCYGGYWLSQERIDVPKVNTASDVTLPGLGLAYVLEDQITLKGQWAKVTIKDVIESGSESTTILSKFNYYTLAVSVTF